MSRHWLFFLILLFIGGGIVWFWYGGNLSVLGGKSFSFNKVLPNSFADLAAKTDEILRGFKEKGDASGKEFLSKATEIPKDIVTNIVKDIKNSVVGNVKGQIAQVFGLSASDSQAISKSIAIVRPINQGIALFIQSDAEAFKYAVKWGDEESTSGSLEAKQQKTLDHIWQSAGDYTISVDIENINDKQQKNFIFPVKIIK